MNMSRPNSQTALKLHGVGIMHSTIPKVSVMLQCLYGSSKGALGMLQIITLISEIGKHYHVMHSTVGSTLRQTKEIIIKM